jgi:hypothetical protein
MRSGGEPLDSGHLKPGGAIGCIHECPPARESKTAGPQSTCPSRSIFELRKTVRQCYITIVSQLSRNKTGVAISGRGEACRLWGKFTCRTDPWSDSLSDRAQRRRRSEGDEGRRGAGRGPGGCVRQRGCVLDIQERPATSSKAASTISRTLFAHGRRPGNCVGLGTRAHRVECEQ